MVICPTNEPDYLWILWEEGGREKSLTYNYNNNKNTTWYNNQGLPCFLINVWYRWFSTEAQRLGSILDGLTVGCASVTKCQGYSLITVTIKTILHISYNANGRSMTSSWGIDLRLSSTAANSLIFHMFLKLKCIQVIKEPYILAWMAWKEMFCWAHVT